MYKILKATSEDYVRLYPIRYDPIQIIKYFGKIYAFHAFFPYAKFDKNEEKVKYMLCSPRKDFKDAFKF